MSLFCTQAVIKMMRSDLASPKKFHGRISPSTSPQLASVAGADVALVATI